MFLANTSIDVIRFQPYLDLSRVMNDFCEIVSELMLGQVPVTVMMEIRRRLTMLNARCTITRGEPYDLLMHVEKHVDLAIRLWSVTALLSKWKDQLRSALSFAHDILQELEMARITMTED